MTQNKKTTLKLRTKNCLYQSHKFVRFNSCFLEHSFNRNKKEEKKTNIKLKCVSA